MHKIHHNAQVKTSQSSSTDPAIRVPFSVSVMSLKNKTVDLRSALQLQVYGFFASGTAIWVAKFFLKKFLLPLTGKTAKNKRISPTAWKFRAIQRGQAQL